MICLISLPIFYYPAGYITIACLNVYLHNIFPQENCYLFEKKYPGCTSFSRCSTSWFFNLSPSPLWIIVLVRCTSMHWLVSVKKSKKQICIPGVGTRRGVMGHGNHAGVCWHLQTGPVIVAGQHGQASRGVLRVTDYNTGTEEVGFSVY